jgi:anti-anti-sigma factor
MYPVTDSPGLSVVTRTERGHIIAALSGELDVASAPELREELLGLLRPAASRLVVDLSAVRYADASGLAVLVGTGRRATLLGGFLRLAAPTPAVTRVLSLTGLHRLLDIFPSVQAAITGLPGSVHRSDRKPDRKPGLLPAGAVHTATPAPASGATTGQSADAAELRMAVAAVLRHADAWRDADPRRHFTPALQALGRAYSCANHEALLQAAQSLLLIVVRRPLTHSPEVAATASRLRRLLHPDSRVALI